MNRGVRLTAKEFQILELLMSYPGRVYSAEEIYEAVWKEEASNILRQLWCMCENCVRK